MLYTAIDLVIRYIHVGKTPTLDDFHHLPCTSFAPYLLYLSHISAGRKSQHPREIIPRRKILLNFLKISIQKRKFYQETIVLDISVIFSPGWKSQHP